MSRTIANSNSAATASTLSNLGRDLQQQQQQQQQLQSSPVTKKQQHSSKHHRDYSSVDVDPTPVKEARRLSSIFQNRSTTTTTSILQPSLAMTTTAEAAATTVQYNLSSLLPRTPTANNNNNNNNSAAVSSISKSTPLSYSKALMKGLDNKSMSATKLFPPACSSDNQQLLHNSNLQEVEPTTTSQTTLLSAQLFSLSTGIDTPHLQHLISNSRRG
jgi:hypothetical protein